MEGASVNTCDSYKDIHVSAGFSNTRIQEYSHLVVAVLVHIAVRAQFLCIFDLIGKNGIECDLLVQDHEIWLG